MTDGFGALWKFLQDKNPFMIIDQKEKLMEFKSREELYLYTLKEIRKYCPKGYVEVPLLIKHLTGFDDVTCEDASKPITKFNSTLSYDKPIFIDWRAVGYDKEKLQAIFKTMHLPTESEFDWAAFEYVWMQFKAWLNEYNEND